MAVVLFGNGVADIRGSIGGTTFSRSIGGATARNRTKPVAGPPTTKQNLVRDQFALANSAYAALSGESVDAWAGFASGLQFTNSLGQTYTPSPKQAFMHANRNVQIAGGSPMSEPGPDNIVPDVDVTAAAVDLLVTGDPSAIDTLTLSGITATVTGSIFYVLQATPPISATKRNYKNLCRQLIVDELTGINAAQLAPYIDLYGGDDPEQVEMAVGMAIGFRIRAISKTTGLSSAWYYFAAAAVAAP